MYRVTPPTSDLVTTHRMRVLSLVPAPFMLLYSLSAKYAAGLRAIFTVRNNIQTVIIYFGDLL